LSWRAFGETFVTLLVVMDPIGNAPIFVALTVERTPQERRVAALQAVLAAGALVGVFALFGSAVLDYLNVSVESLTIAGGALLLLVALEMLRGGVEVREGSTANVALVPLATPLIAGPGAIATVMVLARRNPGASGRAAVIAAIAATIVVIGATLMFAGWLSRLLRPAVIHFLTRVLGLLLSAIAVQLIVDAVRSIVRAG
jgi:MarC family membrane protein